MKNGIRLLFRTVSVLICCASVPSCRLVQGWFGNDVIDLLPPGEPRFSPEGGTYDGEISVTLTTAEPGASIYFTTDGSDPTSSSRLYDSPIPIPADGVETIVRAVVRTSDGRMSSIGERRYTVEPPPVDERGILFASVRETAVVYFDGEPATVDVAELYAMTATGENQTRLTTHAVTDDGVFYPLDFGTGGADRSPDGDEILYRYVTGMNSDEETLFVMNSDGTGGTPIARSQELYDPKWSYDGNRIAYYSFAGESGTDTGICTINPDGTGYRCILPESEYPSGAWTVDHPSWSPDSRRLVFCAKTVADGPPVTFPGRLWIMNADGTGLSEIPGQNTANSGPDWHPAQDLIVYVAEINGQNEIMIMNADGTGVTNLTGDPADDSEPDWSADGTKIVFTSDREGDSEIFTMDADGGNPVNVSGNSAEDWNPSW